MKLTFTNESILALSNTTPRRFLVHDTECRGFCVDLSPAGTKTFYFYGRVGGQPRKIRIGKYPELAVECAREMARGIRQDIADGVADPKPRRPEGLTLTEAFADYMLLYSREHKRTWKRDEDVFAKYLGRLANVPLGRVTRAQVSELVSDLVKGKVRTQRGKGSKSTAHKARSLLSSIFTFSMRQGWCDSNPVELTFRPSYQKRERYLTHAEVARFLAALNELPNETTKDFILVLLLTGARRGNVASMEKSELTLTPGAEFWVIPTSKFKGKRPHVIPLVTRAVEILRRRAAETDRFIFPGRGKSGHLAWPQASIELLRKAAGIEDVRLHDLRRTVGAWQNAAGVPLRVIQETLGHSDISVTASIYTPTEKSAVRHALQEYSEKLFSTPPE